MSLKNDIEQVLKNMEDIIFNGKYYYISKDKYEEIQHSLRNILREVSIKYIKRRKRILTCNKLAEIIGVSANTTMQYVSSYRLTKFIVKVQRPINDSLIEVNREFIEEFYGYLILKKMEKAAEKLKKWAINI